MGDIHCLSRASFLKKSDLSSTAKDRLIDPVFDRNRVHSMSIEVTRLATVNTDELAGCQDVSLHGFFNLGPFRSGR